MKELEQLKGSYSQLVLSANERLEKRLSTRATNYLSIAILSVASALLCCMGINFENQYILWFSLILIPFCAYLMDLSIGICVHDKGVALITFLKFMAVVLMAIILSTLYFLLTPFAYDLAYIASLGQLNIPVYFAAILLGLIYFLNPKKRAFYVISFAGIVSQWMIFICLIGFSIANKDWSFFIKQVNNLILIFGFVFIGVSVLLFIIRRSGDGKLEYKLIFKFLNVIIFILFFSLGLKSIYDATTNYNLEKFISKELNSSSFQVINYELVKSNKEVTIYYHGAKPAITDNEEIKLRYHLQNYHLIYQEVK